MIRRFTKQFLLSFVCLLALCTSAFAQTSISGSVIDSQSKDPLLGASIMVKGKVLGTISDTNGKFSLKVTSAPPLTLIFTMVGFSPVEIEVTNANVQGLEVSLEESAIMGQEVVVSASRVEESVMQSPVSIEKMDILAVKETAAASFYDALANVKGIDMSSQSLTFKTVNMRGFGANGNTRIVQLIDGIDNQAPGLNFAVGNIVGINDLDVESVEVMPGAASALYGPNALNGIILMKSKSPFEYQGLSVYSKMGVNHVGEKLDDPALYQDYGLRYAKSFNNKFAVKITASYLKAQDFRATDTRDQSSSTNGKGSGFAVETPGTNRTREGNRNYDGTNVYGDFGFNLGFLPSLNPGLGSVASQFPTGADGAFSPTGYSESSFVDNKTESLKLGAALHYRITDDLEILGQFNYGNGSTVYTANDRFVLDNFSIWTGKLELKGSNFYIRGYTTQEASGDSYAANTVASLINQKLYLPDYAQAYLSTRGTGASIDQSHAQARLYADGRQKANYAPGTVTWDTLSTSLKKLSIAEGGAKFKDASNMYHAEGSYNLRDRISFAEIVVGGNFRKYNLNSGGTLFALDDDGHELSYHEFGTYIQATKTVLDDKLKIQASGRYDKNQNFDGQISPRVSLVGTIAEKHNLRGSFQHGFRIPTTQDQFIDLDVQTRRLVGSNQLLVDRYNFKTNTVYTAESLAAARAAGNPSLLATPTHLNKTLTTEKINTFEVGYRGLFLDDRLMLDAYYFYSIYQDFISEITFVQAVPNGLRADPAPFDPNSDAGKAAIVGGTVKTQSYGFDVNADGSVKTNGWGVQADYSLGGGYRLGGNVSYNKLLDDKKLREQGFASDFNTPTYRYNVNFGNREVIKNFGYNVAWKWQQAFTWNSSFGSGVIPAFGTLDAQVSYKVPTIKSTFKLGGSNILNEHYTTSYGNPQMGAIYYIQITFDEFLN